MRKRQLRVLLCHSSLDKRAVRDLYRRLKADGFAPWFDEEELLPGQDWRLEIPAAISVCDVVIVCLSQRSALSDGYLQREVREVLYAAGEKPKGTIRVVPARLDEGVVPKPLSQWRWPDVSQEGGYQQLVRALNVQARALGLTAAAEEVSAPAEAAEPAVAEEERVPAEASEPVATEEVRAPIETPEPVAAEAVRVPVEAPEPVVAEELRTPVEVAEPSVAEAVSAPAEAAGPAAAAEVRTPVAAQESVVAEQEMTSAEAPGPAAPEEVRALAEAPEVVVAEESSASIAASEPVIAETVRATDQATESVATVESRAPVADSEPVIAEEAAPVAEALEPAEAEEVRAPLAALESVVAQEAMTPVEAPGSVTAEEVRAPVEVADPVVAEAVSAPAETVEPAATEAVNAPAEASKPLVAEEAILPVVAPEPLVAEAARALAETPEPAAAEEVRALVETSEPTAAEEVRASAEGEEPLIAEEMRAPVEAPGTGNAEAASAPDQAPEEDVTAEVKAPVEAPQLRTGDEVKVAVAVPKPVAAAEVRAPVETPEPVSAAPVERETRMLLGLPQPGVSKPRPLPKRKAVAPLAPRTTLRAKPKGKGSQIVALTLVCAAVAVMVALLAGVHWPTQPRPQSGPAESLPSKPEGVITPHKPEGVITPQPARPIPKTTGMQVRANAKNGLEYVWIPAGTFKMGCSPKDDGCRGDEKPPHAVTIGKGFWIGRTEVTVGAYERFSLATGHPKPSGPSFHDAWTTSNMPVVYVSWNDANDYCTWARGRLPTEAEWEYAARGGSAESRYGDLGEIAWCSNNSGSHPHEVGQKRANGFGLCDTLGNVIEWVNDWYDQSYYRRSPSRDPSGPARGRLRVLRGGSWGIIPRDVRISVRYGFGPADKFNDGGFRCVGGSD